MIIFLYGEDTFRSRQKLQELKEKFIKEVDQSNLNLQALDGLKMDFAQFHQAVTVAPFLAKKRMVIIERAVENKNIQEEVLGFIKKDNNYNNVILVFWEEKKSTNKLFKFLAKEKLAQLFSLLKNAELCRWVEQEVKQKGGTIDLSAVRFLADYSEGDLWLLNNEINKLVAYKGEQAIKKEDVEMMVSTKFADNIFGLVDAIGAKNKKTSIRFLQNQLSFGSSPLYIIHMLIRQYRILLQVKEHSNERAESLAKKIKLHPFVVKKALAQTGKYEFAELKNIYNELLIIDKKIKSSSVEPELLVDLLIAKV